jgi:hypothetical protein
VAIVAEVVPDGMGLAAALLLAAPNTSKAAVTAARTPRLDTA